MAARDSSWWARAIPIARTFPHLKHPPFRIAIGEKLNGWGDLRIDGFIGGKQVDLKDVLRPGDDHQLMLLPDDTSLMADGADTTRVVLRVADEFGRVRPFATDAIRFTLDGPQLSIGDNPFALVGGTGAVWVRAGHQAGRVTLHATHPALGTKSVSWSVAAAEPERA